LEDNVAVDDQFIVALARAFKRFMQFTGAEVLDLAALQPEKIREGVQEALDTV
jgi:hypothetical protein